MNQHTINANRLQPLKQLAETRERTAAEKMAKLQQELVERESKLSMLENYQEPELENTLAAPALLLNREAFRNRLTDAITQQKRVVEDANKRLQETRTQWMERRRDLHAIEEMINRCNARERAAGERKSQHELDEFSARLTGGMTR